MGARSLSRIRAQRGMTFLELFVVLSLVAILAAMASPYLVDLRDRFRLNSATRDVAALIKRARVIAVTRNTWVRVLITEVDPGVSSLSNGGVLRIEIRSYNSDGTWTYRPVETAERPDSVAEFGLLAPGTCRYSSGVMAENCVDLKALYPNSSTGLIWMDDVGTADYYKDEAQEAYNETEKPALFFSPGGRVENLLADFALGHTSNYIMTAVGHKAGDRRVEARLLLLDRGGNLTIEPWKGTGSPSN